MIRKSLFVNFIQQEKKKRIRKLFNFFLFPSLLDRYSPKASEFPEVVLLFNIIVAFLVVVAVLRVDLQAKAAAAAASWDQMKRYCFNICISGKAQLQHP